VWLGSGLSFRGSLLSFVLIDFSAAAGFLLSKGTMGSRWELRHLAGSPGGEGVSRLCHTLIRVNTV
jgi:hypothetical protein